LGQEHVQALDLIAPILNGLQLDLIASEMAARRDKLEALSPRQRDIAQLILSGRDNGGIAAAMRLSEKTVRNNVSEIYARLGLANRAELFRAVAGMTRGQVLQPKCQTRDICPLVRHAVSRFECA
jgi:DNA-binding NarL/FixJ family response regulator